MARLAGAAGVGWPCAALFIGYSAVLRNMQRAISGLMFVTTTAAGQRVRRGGVVCRIVKGSRTVGKVRFILNLI